MHILVSKQHIDLFDNIRIYIQYLAYLISDEKETNAGSIAFQFFDIICPDDLSKVDYNILWADKSLLQHIPNFFKRYTNLYIIVGFDFPKNTKFANFNFLDSNHLNIVYYNKNKLGKSFLEKYQELGVQLNDPRSYSEYSCIQRILNKEKHPFEITWKDSHHIDNNYKKYMPTKKDVLGFRKGAKEIKRHVSIYKNPVVFFIGNSPSYYYWGDPQPNWVLIPISGRMMHNKLDEPTKKQCFNICKYITSKITPETSNIVLVDKSFGDSIQGVITLLKSKCKIQKEITFLNLFDIPGTMETTTRIAEQKFIRLMPLLPYKEWNGIEFEKVIQKHLDQEPVKLFLRKYV